jgi:hypothetical protein
MLFPEVLRPTTTEEFQISESRSVAVPKATPKFRPWQGPPIANTYGSKAVLELAGEPLFAELVILRHFESCGWHGAWIDTFRGRTLAGIDRGAQVPAHQSALLERIAAAAGSSSGCFDVLLWRDSTTVFAEAKRSGRDHVQGTQVRWVAAALSVGIPLESLLVVEWSLHEERAA